MLCNPYYMVIKLVKSWGQSQLGLIGSDPYFLVQSQPIFNSRSDLIGSPVTNNEILRRIQHALNLKNAQIIKAYEQADVTVAHDQVNNWLKDEGEKSFSKMKDKDLAVFLNGFINLKRGKKEGEQPKPEVELTNNMIFMKLRIALNMKAEDVLDVLEVMGISLSKYEIGAYFRKPNNKNYKACDDQLLCDFLNGVQFSNRPDSEEYSA
ncbi:DUF1456 domain-containing protein [Vibrio agarivorans]